MVRIRSRQPATVAGRPLEGEHVPPPEELDELAGAEAFGARQEVDPDDPFGAGARRRDEPAAGRFASGTLVAAAILLVLGGLALVLGLGDDGDDDDLRSDDVATGATTSTTTESVSTSATTATSTVASTTATTSGFTPGTTPTTVARPTVTTLRPSTTLPTTLPANRVMTVSVDVVMADDRSSDIVAGEVADITVRLVDPDAVPSGNCLRVVVEGGLDDDVLADNTCNTDCPSGSSASEPAGGTFENGFSYTFPEDGTYHVVVTATSGRPGCGNQYADRVVDVESSPITVATAD